MSTKLKLTADPMQFNGKPQKLKITVRKRL